MALPSRGMLDDPWLATLSQALWAKPEFSMVPIEYEPVPGQPYRGPRPSEEGLRIIFVGIPSDYGTAFFLHLLEQRINLVAIVCSTRWQRTHPRADLLARIGGHLGRPVELAQNVNAPGFKASLERYQPDLMVMASFDQILDRGPLAVPRLGWMNIHPSRLPRHRGPEPIYWTIAMGDREAGITLHWTVERIDAGPILAQRAIPVRPGETSGSLCKRLVEQGIDALDETLFRLARGDTRSTVPSLEEGSYEPPVRRTELNWDQSYEQIDRLVRAGRPDQPPFVVCGAERRFLTEVERLRDRRGERVGLLEDAPDGTMNAAVRDAVVALSWRRYGHRHALKPLRRQQFP